MSWMRPYTQGVRCARCKRTVFHLSVRYTRDGPYCHDCWVACRKGLYELGGYHRQSYQDPQQRRR